MTKSEQLVTADAVAEYLDVTPAHLAQMRYMGRGPQFIKFGAKVRYRMSDVDDWIDAQTKTQSGVAS